MRGLPVGHFIVKNAKKEETHPTIFLHTFTQLEDLVGLYADTLLLIKIRLK